MDEWGEMGKGASNGEERKEETREGILGGMAKTKCYLKGHMET